MQAPGIHEQAGGRPAYVPLLAGQGLDQGRQQRRLRGREARQRERRHPAPARRPVAQRAAQHGLHGVVLASQLDQCPRSRARHLFRRVGETLTEGVGEQHRGRVVDRRLAGASPLFGVRVPQALEDRVAHAADQRAASGSSPASRATRPSRSSFSRWDVTDTAAALCSASG